MKVTETYTNQNGTKETREIHIPFTKGRSQVCYTLVPTTDEPLALHIIKSGWRDGGPLFHILLEYGDRMDTDYEFGNLEYVCSKWPEFREVYNELYPDVVVNGQNIKEIGNDIELGNHTRKLCINARNSENSLKRVEAEQLSFEF